MTTGTMRWSGSAICTAASCSTSSIIATLPTSMRCAGTSARGTGWRSEARRRDAGRRGRMIPLLHAGLTATIYIALREWFPLPWLWPLDDGLWLAGAVVIITAWSFTPRRETRLVDGAVIGLIVAGLAIIVLSASFPLIARPLLDRLQSPGPDSLRFGMTLAAWSVAAFLFAIAALAGGVIAGAVARWRRLAVLLTIAAMLVPLAATASHAVLGIGLL